MTVRFKEHRRKLEKARKRLRKTLPGVFKEEIITKSIEKGINPTTDGKRRYKRYSESYLKKIRNSKNFRRLGKRKRPINLKLTGDMLKSWFVKEIPTGFKIGFDSEIAVFHNTKGAGKSKVIRRMLPTGDKVEFNRSIRKRIREVISGIINKTFK